MGPVGYTETSLNSYQSSLRNILEIEDLKIV